MLTIYDYLTPMMQAEHQFQGTYSQLYRRLSDRYRLDSVGWPRSPKGLASQLKRQQPALIHLGIECQFEAQRSEDGYRITIHRHAQGCTAADYKTMKQGT